MLEFFLISKSLCLILLIIYNTELKAILDNLSQNLSDWLEASIEQSIWKTTDKFTSVVVDHWIIFFYKKKIRENI